VRHFKSRKFTFALIGTAAVMLVFLSSLGTIVLSPSVAPQVVNLANIAIVFLGSVTGVMLTGQSLVDWKHGSSSQFTEETKRNEDIQVKVEYAEKVTRPRDFSDFES